MPKLPNKSLQLGFPRLITRKPTPLTSAFGICLVAKEQALTRGLGCLGSFTKARDNPKALQCMVFGLKRVGLKDGFRAWAVAVQD